MNHKRPVITVTNVCNLACGGCLEFCGSFSKEQHFFIGLDEFRSNIQSVIAWLNAKERDAHLSFIGVYGGEPTVHPQWDELMKIMQDEYPKYPFVVYTNGRWLKAHSKIGKLRHNITQKLTSPFEEVSEEEVADCIPVGYNQDPFDQVIEREDHHCPCGGQVLKAIGMTRTKYPRDVGVNGIGIYTRCSECNLPYKLTTPEISSGFSHEVKPELQSQGCRDAIRAELRGAGRGTIPFFDMYSNMYVDKNVGYRIGSKDKLSVVDYVSCSVAPMDLFPDKDWFAVAREQCFLWNNCETTIYKNKAYFCVAAGAMDHLYYDGKYGWEVGEGNPFVRTDEEICDQAQHFCKRCGQCCHKNAIEPAINQRQFSCSKTLATKTNYYQIKNVKNTVLVEPPKLLL